jgi:energy-coupling factor transporter ATP-binding protein EcfA2
MIVWITGAPGAGKSTLAEKFKVLMPDAVILDGDEVRKWLTPDCGFSVEGRRKHAQRIMGVARLVKDAIVAVVAHPPEPVDLLVLVEGHARRPLWDGTTYTPPAEPDVVVRT